MLNFQVSFKIAHKTFSILPGKRTGQELYSLAAIPCDKYQLLLDIAEEVDIPIQQSDVIVITGNEQFVIAERCNELPNNPHLRNDIPFFLNGSEFTGDRAFKRAKISTEELKLLTDDNSADIRFVLDLDGLPDQVMPDEYEIVVGHNWRLITTPVTSEGDCVDIEDCSAECDAPAPAHYYRIRINDNKHTVDVPHLLGRELLVLAGVNNPEQHALYQQSKGGATKRVNPADKVDFTAPGVERFTTIPLDMTEGLDVRRQFQLAQSDIEFLNSLQLPWEAVLEGHVRRIVIHQFPIPEGYNVQNVLVNMRIEAGYPEVQIDMAYFYPTIQRLDNKPIRATVVDQFDGKQWQRWSRHRTPNNPWRPGIDNISTHVAAIAGWLQQELLK